VRRCVISIVFAGFPSVAGAATGEDFAKPPEWTDEVRGVFFDDARQALAGEPPLRMSDTAKPSAGSERSDDAMWRALITAEALESAVKAGVNRVAQSVRQPARFRAGLRSDCRRELTVLGTLFDVIGAYAGEVRWKKAAPQLAQQCLRAAEACSSDTEAGLAQVNATLVLLAELLRGPVSIDDPPSGELLAPELAPLMQSMEYITDNELGEGLSKQSQFRKQAIAVAEKAQLLAVLSQVIRRQEYGYADDETYQGHADKLRDAAGDLREAATVEDFVKSVQAATAIQQACADCHAGYRG
jgi:hypothetical protein